MANKVHNTLRLVVIAMYASLVFSLQIFLAIIPNVELVTFLISIAAIVFPFQASFLITITFIFLEMIIYGTGDWVLLYFVVWLLLWAITILFKTLHLMNWITFIIVNSIFGFGFGSVDALIKLMLYGKEMMYAYWIKGLPFDLIHGISNSMIAVLLYKPILNLFKGPLNKYV